MKEKKHYNIRDNEILKNCVNELITFSNTLLKNGKTCEVTFGIYEKDRSVLANNYLHGWCFRIQLMRKLNEAGIGIPGDDGKHYDWCVDSLKAFFKAGWFRDQIIEPDFIMIKGRRFEQTEFRPSDLNSRQFAKYCDVIADYVAERWGITVEEPTGGKYKEMYDNLKLGK